ncbi:MAG: hypothetical protein ACRDMH_05210 [Solirubrobacterales bacterium]
MNDKDSHDALADAFRRLSFESNELVKSATLNRDGDVVVPVGSLNRLRRELKGERQPSMAWMSAS